MLIDLQCCLNGARTAAEHPALPVTAAQVTATVAAIAPLVTSVHLHPKDDDGVDTFEPTAVAEAVRSSRAAARELPVGITTGAWALPSVTERVRAIGHWRALPDFASVNWHEDGADEVAAALLARGIAVEAGLWHVDGLQRWFRSPVRDRCLRVLVEVQDLPEPEALASAAALVDGVRGTRPEVPILLHGEERSAWPVLREAGRRGLATRIGLEDSLTMPDGARATDTLALVRCARQLLR